MPIITSLAIAAGKTAGLLSRRLGFGGGTNLPGALARRFDPQVLRSLVAELPQGVVLVAGTNGKTTTSRMLAAIFEQAGEEVLHNRAGANLITGLTATAIGGVNWRGQPCKTIGLFETDEAALPQALAETQPRLLLIHNLFRDQLDRYGEVDTVAQAWHTALRALPPEAIVVLNADDPAVADLGRNLHARVVYYGLDDARHASGAAAHTADSQFCRRCGHRYDYLLRFYGHIGHYRCPQCDHQRPQPQVQLKRLDLHGTSDSRLFLSYPGGALEVALPIPGLYNALNALAATAVALQMQMAPTAIRAALEHFSAAFGRIERVQAGSGGADMLIALIKNPVGASETVRMLVTSEQAEVAPLHLVIAINDRLADGTDVSWLWDADFEALVDHVAHVTVSGTRAADMAVRLKYAGLDTDKVSVVNALGDAVDAALGGVPHGQTLYLLPTYTAMLDLRALLAARGWVRPFWEE
jgi:UDP-N-acetylmuramyl tripeptide synthase